MLIIEIVDMSNLTESNPFKACYNSYKVKSMLWTLDYETKLKLMSDYYFFMFWVSIKWNIMKYFLLFSLQEKVKIIKMKHLRQWSWKTEEKH